MSRPGRSIASILTSFFTILADGTIKVSSKLIQVTKAGWNRGGLARAGVMGGWLFAIVLFASLIARKPAATSTQQPAAQPAAVANLGAKPTATELGANKPKATATPASTLKPRQSLTRVPTKTA